MSTSVKEMKRALESPNGTAVEARTTPMFALVAAPMFAITASMVATIIARRRRAQAASKPSVQWSFSFASGNRVEFRPTLAPRFSSLLVRGRGLPVRRFAKK